MEAFLKSNGRVHLIRPAYQALVENGEDAELARELFETARPHYHPLTIRILGRLITGAGQ